MSCRSLQSRPVCFHDQDSLVILTLLSPTHLILICQTRVCFGRNRALGHTRAWACYRPVTQPTARFFHPDLTMEMALKLPISLFKWRWYWQGYHICFQRMWAWQTSVHLQLPCSLITKRAHAHWVGHGQTSYPPPPPIIFMLTIMEQVGSWSLSIPLCFLSFI